MTSAVSRFFLWCSSSRRSVLSRRPRTHILSGFVFWKQVNDGHYLKLDGAGPLHHLDYGYAVTSFSSQRTTVGRALVEIDASKSAQLFNGRIGYVAASRFSVTRT